MKPIYQFPRKYDKMEIGFPLNFLITILIVLFFQYSGFAQTNAQKLQIQSNTNVSALNQISPSWQNTSLQEKQLAEQWANNNGYPIEGTTPDGSYFRLVKLDNNGFPSYYITNNANSAKTISTNKVHSGGGAGLNLTGQNYRIGQWDAGGVKTTHTEYSGRATAGETGLSNHFHSTHVAGTMIASGVNSSAKGMAPSADLVFYDFSTGHESQMASEAATNSMLFSNHSYGFNRGWGYGNYAGNGNYWFWFNNTNVSSTEDNFFGFYSAETNNWDVIANNAPSYLIVKSAGNDRGYGPAAGQAHYHLNSTNTQWVWSTDNHEIDGGTDGYDCIDQLGVAKNILTVGAIKDIPNGWNASSDVVMTSFSSWGPTDDGRIKPDIVANGECLFSTWDQTNLTDGSCNGTSGNGLDYYSISGTSMAAPSVTGSLALLQEHYSNTHSTSLMLASSLKALVIESADEAGANNGPDYSFGWGLMNTKRAAELITKDQTEPRTIQELTLNNGEAKEIYFYYGGSSSFLSATIVWNDPVGAVSANTLNPTVSRLVNDLDLRLIKQSDGTITSPWTLNPASPSSAATKADNIRDNVEQVRMYGAAAGTYVARISHKGTLASAQNFSIIINEIGNCTSTQLDLFSKDGQTGDDFGIEPYAGTGLIYLSTDIWVRNQADGIANQTSQNPECSPTNDPNQLNYVYVRVRNKGCVASSGTETLDLRWAKASTSLSWPTNWNGTLDLIDGDLLTTPNAIAGNTISTQTITTIIPAGGETILEFTWNPPCPADYSFNIEPWHFCLLSRIVSTNDPMTVTEGTNLGSNVANNNNIAWKNLTVVDNFAGLIGGGCPAELINDIGVAVAVRNPDDKSSTYDIKFSVPQEELTNPITQEGKVMLVLDDQLYEKWVQGGKQGTGFNENLSPPMSADGANNNQINTHSPIVVSNRKMFEATGTTTQFNNITLQAGESRSTSMMITYPTDPVSTKQNFKYDIIQKRTDNGEFIGGVRYDIMKPVNNDPQTDAGNNVSIKRGCNTTLVASPQNDCYVYFWLNEQGNIISRQPSITVSPNTTTTYTVKIVSSQGFVSKDDVTVNVTNQQCQKEREIVRITPNPAKEKITVKYRAENTNVAHLRLVKTDNSIDKIYPLNLQMTEITLNISDCTNGSYVVSLVCNGVIEDSKSLMMIK